MKKTLLRIFLGLLGLIVLIIAVFAILLVLPAPASPQVPEKTDALLIQNASVVDLEGDSIKRQSILIENGTILQVSHPDSMQSAAHAEVIDASGQYVIPGLWDMHAHLIPHFSPQLTLPLFLAGGVTNIRDLGGGPYDEKKKMDEAVRANTLVGPRIQAIGASTVYYMDTLSQVNSVIEGFEGQGPDFIKVYNAVLPEYFFPLMEEAQKKGIPVLGHKPRAINAIDISRAGFRSIEHARLFLFECYPGAEELRQAYYDRYTGKEVPGGALDRTENLRKMIDDHDEAMFSALVDTMIAYDTWFCPTHITRKMDAFADNEEYRNDPRLRYMHFLQRWGWNSDADGMVEGDPSPEGRKTYMDFYLKGLELTGKAHQSGLKILAGTDANDTYCFPGFSLHDELEELVRAGLSPAEALKTATIYPAEYFGLTDEYGSIEVGKTADLILLEDNPLDDITNTQKIKRVIFSGTDYSREDLDRILKSVDKAAGSWNIGAKFVWREMR